jgi:hypothetical protein
LFMLATIYSFMLFSLKMGRKVLLFQARNLCSWNWDSCYFHLKVPYELPEWRIYVQSPVIERMKEFVLILLSSLMKRCLWTWWRSRESGRLREPRQKCWCR